MDTATLTARKAAALDKLTGAQLIEARAALDAIARDVVTVDELRVGVWISDEIERRSPEIAAAMDLLYEDEATDLMNYSEMLAVALRVLDKLAA